MKDDAEKNPVRSAHKGVVKIGDAELECHVLEDERRIFSSRDFLLAFGLKPEPKKEEKRAIRLFLERVKFISLLGDKTLYNALNNPIKFKRDGKGGNLESNGYPADLLPEICNAILALSESRMLPIDLELKNAAKQSRKLLKGLANVGVVALIDEATGYQDYRNKRALQDILDQYLKKEYAAWAKRFPDEFYKEMFRLKKWDWMGVKENKPGVVGRYTRDLVYSRLAPGVIQELEQRNPPIAPGRRRTKHHQWLTDDIGHPALGEHLHALITLMRISTSWDQFYRFVTKAFPVHGEQQDLDLYDD
jgi:hypothetical protein